MKLTLPYSHLNLRCNPFGETTPEERAQLAVADVEPFIGYLREPGFALQFLGARGRGKTSHLLALRRHFPDAPYLHIPEGEKIPEIPETPLLFLDETQRFSRRRRRRLFRRKASFVLGTHEDHSREFRQAGLNFATVHLEGVTVDRLRKIIGKKIEWARRSHGAVPEISRKDIVELIRIFGDNIRAIEGRLYETFQKLEVENHGKM